MNKSVLIIGAGAAGISAAINLVKGGYRVTVVDSRNEPGGRARSSKNFETGYIIDNGQHLLIGAYEHFIGLLKTLGTERFLDYQHSLRVPYLFSDSRVDILDTSVLRGKAGMLAGILRLKMFSFKEKLAAIKFLISLKLFGNNTDRITAFELLKKHNQSANLIEYLWKPIILATLNAQPERASAKIFMETIKRAFLTSSDNSRLIFPSCGLSELFEPFPDWLNEAGSKYIGGCLIEKLIVDNGICKGAISKSGELFEADYIISAIPPYGLSKILPENVKELAFFADLTKIEYSPIVSVYLWLDKKITDEKVISLLGTQTQWLFNRNAISNDFSVVSDKYDSHITLTISAADEFAALTADEIVTICLNELKQIFPEYRDLKTLHSKVIKEKRATMLITPESEKFRLTQKTSVPNLFLAGDWTDTGLPATLESAALSGFLAAKCIIEPKDSSRNTSS